MKLRTCTARVCFPVFAAVLWTATPAVAADPVLGLDFDAPALRDLAGDAVIHTQFERPGQVPGVLGKAWRTDGFSSWLAAPVYLAGSPGFAVAAWVALESYPSDLEVPVESLSPSSIVHQRRRGRGFEVFIDTYGRWGLWVGTTSRNITLHAPERFPLYAWTHVAASVDGLRGTASLFLNGEAVATATLPSGSEISFAATDLEFARSHTEAGYLNFTFNRLNGAYDEVAVYRRALAPGEVRQLHARLGSDIPEADGSLVVPESRFAGDFHRPKFHAMPPANWTNEPHGLVRMGETWHLFYQRTPNGPFKTQMHWGHMASDDLVTWRHLRDALRPELQDDRFGFDQKGIWSGDVIVDDGMGFAFYTSVNHSHRIAASNPGVAMAISEDPNLETWRKTGPIINTEHVQDFRDPYLWREGNTWHMLIGASVDTGGGLAYYVLERGANGGRWVYRKRFSSLAYRILDVGSAIWEMPVFEPLGHGVHVLVVNPVGGRVSKYGELATRAVYWTGRWQDGLFRPFHREPKMLDLIPGHLAPTVARAADGQLRAIGIVDERRTPQAQEDAGWAHTFSFPRVWRLMPDATTLGQAPAPELEALRGETVAQYDALPLGEEADQLHSGAHAMEIDLAFDDVSPDSAIVLEVMVSPDREEATRLIFDTDRGEVVLDKSRSTLSAVGEGPDLLRGSYDADAFGVFRNIRAFIDGSVVDVFVNDAAAFSFRSYPHRRDSTGVWISAPRGRVRLSGVTIRRLTAPAG